MRTKTLLVGDALENSHGVTREYIVTIPYKLKHSDLHVYYRAAVENGFMDIEQECCIFDSKISLNCFNIIRNRLLSLGSTLDLYDLECWKHHASAYCWDKSRVDLFPMDYVLIWIAIADAGISLLGEDGKISLLGHALSPPVYIGGEGLFDDRNVPQGD